LCYIFIKYNILMIYHIISLGEKLVNICFKKLYNKISIIYRINVCERYQFLLVCEPLNKGDIMCCNFFCKQPLKSCQIINFKFFFSWNEFATLRGEKHKYVRHWKKFQNQLVIFWFRENMNSKSYKLHIKP